MNILILGSGGREHAFAWKMKQSPKCHSLFVAPGNAGTQSIATNLKITPTNFEEVEKSILAHKITLLVVGPEDPLVQGIVNYFRAKKEFDDLIIIGPDKAGAELEGSKDFSKAFMSRHKIPTAKSETFTAIQYDAALTYIKNHAYPL
ncbi:Phosphoribosylamine--glycine ligase, partial [hydrothermal vent metagenome]